MSLFVINRYEGEVSKPEEEETNKNSHLSALLKRIEERKLEKAKATKVSETLLKVKETNEEPVKKKTKKVDESILENQDSSILNDTEESTPLKKKKKKKKEKNLIQNETLEKEPESVNNTEENKSVEPSNNFMILGSKSKKKVKEVKRILPDWLAHPEIISADLSSGPILEELDFNLDSNLVKVLKTNGVTHLFPVQKEVIAWLLKCNESRKLGYWPRHTCVSAPTGSGKTLAYVLPIIQQLQDRVVPKIRCLIVLPVQELAMQVYKVMKTYSEHTELKVLLLSGASSFEQEQNAIAKKNWQGEYVSCVDIIVATTGRLVEHMLKTPGFNLDSLRFIVIDEADRETDWLEYLPEFHKEPPSLTLDVLHSCAVPPAQKLLFSATLSQDPEKLSRLGLFHPILFTSVIITDKDEDVDLDKEVNSFIGRYTSPEELIELAVECAAEYKPVALYQLLMKTGEIVKSLVFTNSGETAHRLALLMQSLLSEKNVIVGEISAQLNSKQREDVLNKFAKGETHVLISSDALARGLDIQDIQLVVSYDLPKHIKGYIHRAGRTGRAGKIGTAVSVLTTNQVGIFKHMLHNAQKKIPEIEKLDSEDIANTIDYQSHVEKLKNLLEKEKVEELQRKKSTKQSRKRKIIK